MANKEEHPMDDLTWARQLIDASEAAERVRAEETWNRLLDSPEFGLRELIEQVGIDPLEARQVLTDARIGDHSALLMIVLGRKDEVREALLRMRHGHF
jgi:hypothetical protein